MKLARTIKYQGEMKLISGLAIKSSGNELNIGGADSEVIKNPLTKQPYIPGSSLKGKMRSLLEFKYGRRQKKEEKNKDGKKIFRIEEREDGDPCGCGKADCMICTIFGAHKNPKAESAPTRIIVRDCNLTKESQDMLNENGGLLEEKAENIINRKDGTAGSPRTIERIPAGLSFTVEIVLQIFEGDNEKEMKEKVEEALKLLEDSYLGGSGSRGYGQVKFKGQWV